MESKMPARGGFTLIEMMTVMAILGIAAACVVPLVGTRDDLDVAAAARSVTADLLYAQNRAIATQRKHFVAFNGSGYTILSQASDTAPLCAITNPTTQNSYVVTLGSANATFSNINIASVDFDGSPNLTIEFDTLGAPSVYNTTQGISTPLINSGTIILATAATGQTASVVIDPATGEASAQ
jgi:type II secretion system protein H